MVNTANVAELTLKCTSKPLCHESIKTITILAAMQCQPAYCRWLRSNKPNICTIHQLTLLIISRFFFPWISRHFSADKATKYLIFGWEIYAAIIRKTFNYYFASPMVQRFIFPKILFLDRFGNVFFTSEIIMGTPIVIRVTVVISDISAVCTLQDCPWFRTDNSFSV